jgi:hypothetical protein
MGLIAAGLGAGLLGTALGASSANTAANRLRDAAMTPYVSLPQVYSETANAAQGILPQEGQIASQATQEGEQTLTQELNQAIPGFAQGQAQRTANANALLSGQLPPDVQALVQRNANAGAIAGGYGGSPRAGNLEARDLGLTSLNLEQQGATDFANIVHSTPMAPLVTPGQMLISPSQDFQANLGERAQQIQGLQQWAGAPTSGQVFGQGLASVGGLLAGAGLGGTSIGSLLGTGTGAGVPIVGTGAGNGTGVIY